MTHPMCAGFLKGQPTVLCSNNTKHCVQGLYYCGHHASVANRNTEFNQFCEVWHDNDNAMVIGDTCRVCNCEFNTTKEQKTMPCCGCVIHSACIAEWCVNQNRISCPCCRASIKDVPVVKKLRSAESYLNNAIKIILAYSQKQEEEMFYRGLAMRLKEIALYCEHEGMTFQDLKDDKDLLPQYVRHQMFASGVHSF